MPHRVGALIDTAFVRRAVADATEPAGTPHPMPLSAWALVIARARAAIVRLTARG
jgi:hypothetical protein